MKFKNNFVPLKYWFETYSNYMVDLELKIRLICGQGKQEQWNSYFDAWINYDTTLQADHLVHTVTPDEVSREPSAAFSLNKVVITPSENAIRIGEIRFDCGEALQSKDSGSFVIKCRYDEDDYKLEARLIAKKNVPIISENAEAFLIHILRIATDFGTWDKELKRCEDNPFFTVKPKKLVFVLKKSFAACVSKLTGQSFQKFRKDEVIYLQREGRV